MLLDGNELYKAHVENVQNGNPEPEKQNIKDGKGTWTGHRDRYKWLKDRLNEQVKGFKAECDDLDDDDLGPNLLNAELLVDMMEEYDELKPPNEPNPLEVFLPNWAIKKGVHIRGRSVVVPKATQSLGEWFMNAIRKWTEEMNRNRNRDTYLLLIFE